MGRCCAPCMLWPAGTPRLGVELDAPNGKNNGTVKGHRCGNFSFSLPFRTCFSSAALSACINACCVRRPCDMLSNQVARMLIGTCDLIVVPGLPSSATSPASRAAALSSSLIWPPPTPPPPAGSGSTTDPKARPKAVTWTCDPNVMLRKEKEREREKRKMPENGKPQQETHDGSGLWPHPLARLSDSPTRGGGHYTSKALASINRSQRAHQK